MVNSNSVILSLAFMSKQHDCFCDWIAIFDVPKVSEIVKLSPRVVRLGWQTRDSSIDCGIFTMRHMETYMGNLFRWNSGLRTETVRIIFP